jgi:DNA-directed RNA polymerase subunit RPC12/RpoP
MTLKTMKNFLLDLHFPPLCVNCKREGKWLCEDCQSLIEILEDIYCPVCNKKISNLNYITQKKYLTTKPGVCGKCKDKTNLDGLFGATSHENFVARKVINSFKNKHIIDLSDPMSEITYYHLYQTGRDLNNFQIFCKNNKFSKAFALRLSEKTKMPFLKNPKGKKVLIVSEEYPDKEVESLALSLKEKGAKEVWGAVFIRN